MPNPNCPSREELFGYLVGTLPEDVAEHVSEHISSCAPCAETLRTMNDTDDRLVARLRAAGEEDPYRAEPQRQAVIAGVQAMAGGPTAASDETLYQAVTGPIVPLELGEYQLLEKLGEGGMGTVYKARHVRLDKLVAVKVLLQEQMTDPRSVARFEREMKAVGRVDHPHLVRAMDAREIGGTRFLVMEYVEGRNLAELVRHAGALRIADACELARQVAVGLQCAHENGLIHRDIKPSNVILTPAGQVKILDLGLALLHAERSADPQRGGMTTTGAAMGTADYVAPEQVSDAHSVDVRADIYSLGCTLYKLLAGRPPFIGPRYQSPMDKMVAHLRDAPPSIQVARPDVPPELAAIIERMMAKDPTQRYAAAREVAEALTPFAVGADVARLCAGSDGGLSGIREADPSRAGIDPLLSSAMTGTSPGGAAATPLAPVLRGERAGVRDNAANATQAAAPSRIRRRPAALIALGLCGVALLAGTIILRIRDRSGRETVVEVPAGSKATVRPNGEVEIDLSSAEGEMGTKPSAANGDTEHRVPPPAVAARRQSVPVADEEPNRSLLPRRLETPGVGRWHIDTRMPRAEARGVSWSPDGRLVAYLSWASVRVYEAATCRLVYVFSHRPEACYDSAFSPDGKWIAIRYDDGEVRLWEVASGKAGPVLATRSGWKCFPPLAWSPDSQHLARCWDSKVDVFQVDGRLIHSWHWPSHSWLCGWSRDGKWLLLVNDAVGAVLRAPDGKPGPEIEEADALAKHFQPMHIAWSPDGNYFAAEIRMTKNGGDDKDCSKIYVWNTQTWKLLRKSDELEWIEGLAWTADSRRVIFSRYWINANSEGRSRTEAWAIGDNSFLPVMAKKDVFAGIWALSPKGEQIVEVFDQRILFWDVGAKEPRSIIDGSGSRNIGLLGASPDGQWLATKRADGPTCLLWHGDGRPGPSLPELSNGLTALAWGPDGRLASGHQNVVRAWNAKDGQLVWQWPRLEQAPSILAWSPDGRQLVASGVDKTIHLWNVEESSHAQTVVAHTGTVNQVAWSADGGRFASLGRAEKCVRLWNADATAGPVLNAGEAPARQFAWSPDGQQIAVLPEQGPLQLFSTAGERVLEIPNTAGFVEWSPDGKWLATGAANAQNATALRIHGRDGAARPGPCLWPYEIPAWDESFWRPDWRRWSPNAKWLTVGITSAATWLPAAMHLWDVKANLFSLVLQDTPPCAAVCWSSDSQHLLSINGDQTLRHWDVGNGRILATTVLLRNDQWARITDDGKVETSSPEAEKELVYVVEDPQGAQKIYGVAEFQALVAQQTAGDR